MIEKDDGDRYSQGMRLRIIILILALFAFVSASTGGFLYYYAFRNASFEKIEFDAQARLNLLRDQLSYHLSEHTKPVKTLAGMKELKTVLEIADLNTIYSANQVLDHFSETLEIDVGYLLDIDGITLCSSNRNAPDSFVGNDFSFRPYFKNAVQGRPSTYLALGTTSRIRGVYHSHPVWNRAGDKIIGVAVIKASIEYVETKLFQPSDDLLFLTDPNGMIFIANRPEFRFNLLWEKNEDEIGRIMNSRQFGNGPWPWAGFSMKSGSGQVMDPDRNRFRLTLLDMDQYPGWRIVSLRNYKDIKKLLSEPFVKVVGPAITSILGLTGLLVLILYHLGVKEITKRKKAEKELRLSEERYRLIYHKTPVMLHSIDTSGIIIHVSDHWVDVMGYARDEVVGRPLIDFFTADSQKYAIQVVFPEFFSTGFCKDIPYTYVKKDGDTMDILLSCYGVRNDAGKILRSLAVSVDVTERNRAQKELHIAKEKLAQYSLDLERQVAKRTAQLERTQANLKNVSKNIITSQEREKALVARELHDHLGQVLTALRIDAVWIQQYFSRLDENAHQRALKMCSLIDDTIEDVRNMAYRLRPRVLDDLGLSDALESLVADFEKRSDVSCVFRRGLIPKIDDTLATALYRIGQEALTNALRHSRAATIMVDLSTDEEGIVLTIEDDGDGFDGGNRKEADGFGLEGMKERANLVGGRLDISRRKPRGTIVCCKVKVEDKP